MLTGKRVLIVEDDPMIAMVLEDMLLDFDVLSTHHVVSNEHALTAINNERFDVAILDSQLGRGATSEPTAAVLHERGIPFLYSTGYTKLDNPYGVPVVLKPYDPVMLEEAITSLTSEPTKLG